MMDVQIDRTIKDEVCGIYLTFVFNGYQRSMVS